MRQFKFRGCFRVVLACAALSGCTAIIPSPPSQQEVDVFARSFLDSIQSSSIRDSREYCGYFFVSDGGLQATKPDRGLEASCRRTNKPFNTIASYHTHGSYGKSYDNEVPSVTDLVNTRSAGIDDYVSTPGGRLWRVAGTSGEAIQLCGLQCLTSDPNFVANNEATVAQSYTITTVRERQSR